jgi:hypothetical protein
MSKPNTTKTTDFSVAAREIDFVTRFTQTWQALMDILGIMRPIRKESGTRLESYNATVDLEDGNVGEGEEIPYSLAKVTPVAYGDVTIEKYAKAITLESVDKYGPTIAIQKTDNAFLNELQLKVLRRFYNFLQTGTLVGTAGTFQEGIALSIGSVKDIFQKMHKDVTSIVTFVNTMDYYKYLGTANITIQTEAGITYVKNFMDADVMILSSEIPRGKVISVPVENIDLYYVDPSSSDFAQLGLNYTVEGATNLIGFHVQGNYTTAVGEVFALMGMALWAEYLNGIAVFSVNDSSMTDATAGAPSAVSYWGTNVSDIQEDIAVSAGRVTGTLKKLTSGQLVTDWGEGYFLALKFTNFSSGVTYKDVKVGLVPSQGSGLVTLDPDQDAVMKITDKDSQKVAIVQTIGDTSRTQYLDLSGLVLEEG